MYWTDWGVDAQIERCGMNGDLTTRETVVKGMFGFPNGLAIDYKEEKLWWADAMLDKIETSNLDGSLRRIVVAEESIHPFGLIVYNNSILWTDWVDNMIFKADKLAGKIYFSKDVGAFRPTGIRVVHEQMYPKGMRCNKNNNRVHASQFWATANGRAGRSWQNFRLTSLFYVFFLVSKE